MGTRAHLEEWVAESLHGADPESLRRVRLLVGFYLSILPWPPIFSVITWSVGSPEGAIALLVVTALLALTLPILRWSGSVVAATHWFCFQLYWILGFEAAHAGGHGAPALMWNCILPLVAILVAGARAGIVWTVLANAQVLAFYLMNVRGYTFLQQLQPEGMKLSNVTCLMGLQIAFLFFGLIYESARNRSLLALQNANQKLEVALEEARQANRSKNEFLANISHELRTPLNGILGTTSLLAQSHLEEEQRRYVQVANQSCVALLSIINDVLDLSKMEAGHTEIRPVTFCVADVLDELRILLGEAAASKSLGLWVYVQPDVPRFVVGDALRMRQILTNLIGNALKFTEQGYVVVEASMVQRSGDEVRLRFSVQDTGVGIARELQDRLFIAFSQVDASAARRHQGTGLGLAISQRLARLMGGDLSLESQPGQGSIFRFEAPYEVKEEAAPFPFPPRPVLVASGDETTRRLMGRVLTSWGLGVTETDGRDASRANGVDLIVAEDTLEPSLLDELIQWGFASSAPVILLGGGTSTPPGVAAQIPRPWRQELLRAVVERTLGWLSTTVPETPPEVPNLGLRVLLVEDNEINYLVAATMLTKLGCEVAHAPNGKHALEAHQQQAFDLIFMDCHMPDMDGYTVTREIRRQEGETRHTPIIAMTASAMPEEEERCRAAGMDDFVPKPIYLSELLRTLERWSQGKGQAVERPGS